MPLDHLRHVEMPSSGLDHKKVPPEFAVTKPHLKSDPGYHLALGHVFARAWEATPRLSRPFLLNQASRRSMMNLARKGLGDPPTEAEALSHRIQLGRVLAASETSILPLILAAPVLGRALAMSRIANRDMLKALEVDIGLPGDPLLLAGTSMTDVRDRRRWLLELPSAIESLALQKPARFIAPLLYLSGMPYKEVPSGYGRRTASTVDALRRNGIRTDIVHLNFETANSLIDDVQLLPDRQSNLELWIDAAVDNLVARARQHGSLSIASGSNWLSGYIALRAARRLDLPFIYDVRGLWAMTRAFTQRGYAKTLAYRSQLDAEAMLMRVADQCFFISEGLRDWAALQGAAPARTSVVPNMIPKAFLDADAVASLTLSHNSDTSRWILGHAGSLTSYEGLNRLVDIIRLSEGRLIAGKRLHLWIAGTGPFEPLLRDHVSRSGVTQNVSILGQQSVVDVRRLISETDVMVFPRENGPLFDLVPALKPVEAMAAGRIVLASHLKPHLELAGPKPHRLVIEPSIEPEAWLARLETMLSNPDVSSGAMAARARDWVIQNRAPDVAVKPWLDLFETSDLNRSVLRK